MVFILIHYLHNPIIQSSFNPPPPPKKKICMIIVCKLLWDMKMSSGKSKTMPMQIFGGLKKCIMGFVQVVNEKNEC